MSPKVICKSCSSDKSLEMTSIYMEREVNLRPPEEVIGEITSELRSGFQQVVEQWDKDTLFESNPHAFSQHSAFQEVISMGESAIPLMLEQVATYPHQFFPALRELTGEDPSMDATTTEYGFDKLDVEEAVARWQEWGVEKGYLSIEDEE